MPDIFVIFNVFILANVISVLKHSIIYSDIFIYHDEQGYFKILYTQAIWEKKDDDRTRPNERPTVTRLKNNIKKNKENENEGACNMTKIIIHNTHRDYYKQRIA